MRFIIGLVLVAVLAYFAPIVLPWWGIAPLAAIVGFATGAKWWQSLLFGLLSTGLVWGIYTMGINNANEGILSSKIAEILNLSGGGTLVMITAFIGALLGGLGALSGGLLREGLLPIKNKNARRSPNISYRNKKRRKKWR